MPPDFTHLMIRTILNATSKRTNTKEYSNPCTAATDIWLPFFGISKKNPGIKSINSNINMMRFIIVATPPRETMILLCRLSCLECRYILYRI